VSKTRTGITVASAAALAICLPAVKKSEGYWPTVKVDTVGTGRPCTGGYGETEGVKCGETHSEKYWADKLKMRLADEYDREIGQCIHVQLPDSARAAMITTAYNAGSAAVCRSPMVAKMNAGDVRGGCEALLTKDANGSYSGWYIRAQGRILPGLIHRRRDDQKMCLAYLVSDPHADRVIHAAALKHVADEAKAAAELAEIEAMPPKAAPPATPLPKPRRAAAPAPVRHWWSWIFK
jgi:lysozyme